MFGAVGAILQGLEVMGIIATPPAIEGLGTDIKMATRKTRILTAGVVIVKPLQPLPGLSGEVQRDLC